MLRATEDNGARCSDVLRVSVSSTLEKSWRKSSCGTHNATPASYCSSHKLPSKVVRKLNVAWRCDAVVLAAVPAIDEGHPKP